MKKLLFVATRQFWPTSTGKEITLFYNCKGLHERFGYDIYLFCFANGNTDKLREKPDFIKDVMYVNAPGIVKMVANVVCHCVFGLWPLQNAMFYDGAISEALMNYYNKVRPSVLVIDMVRLVPYVDRFLDQPVKRILIEDDLLSKRYARQIQATKKARTGGSLTGYYSSGLPGVLNKVSNILWIKKSILKTEINHLTRYEAQCVKKFAYITFISPIEAEEYNRMHGTNKAITLTMGADTDYLADGEASEKKKNALSVIANFNYAPNIASLEWIVREILPLLPEDVHYYVAGKYPDSVKEFMDPNRVTMMGYVDDIRSFVKGTEIYLSPIAYGTGIKTKIVEAMAMGIPVITNSVGAEGLNVTNGKELFIAEDPEEIAKMVMKLLSNPGLREKVGKQGQDYVRQYHDWERVYDAFEKMNL